MAADANEIPTLPPLPASVPAAACPEWNLQDLAHRPCPVCGEDPSRPICRRPDGLVVTACAGCRMLYVTETPKPEAIEDFYRTYARHKFQGHRKTPLARGKARRQSLRDPVIRILEATGGLEGRYVLDVEARALDQGPLRPALHACPEGRPLGVLQAVPPEREL